MKDASAANKKGKDRPDSQETSLKGTFVSVLIIGVIMLVSWFGVFLLFLERN
ncbi:MAG TPA: cytochrome c oxidase subunit 2A [Planococcus sp. (in: firmicutes)]|nr:cytochrome c oxidase subunit 2A [Planococcus sp. (in: firmicutes)]